MPRYKLRTLMILLAIGPPVIGGGYWWWYRVRTERLFREAVWHSNGQTVHILPESKPGFHWEYKRGWYIEVHNPTPDSAGEK